MITGIGVDSASVVRIESSLQRFGERLERRVLHPSEIEDYRVASNPARYLAKRFAVKEAASKALGTGIREGVSLRDFSTRRDRLGKPSLFLHGVAQAMCQSRGIDRFHVSITDEGDAVIAFVVFESSGELSV